MFKWLNKQGVESTSGYILQRVSRFSYEYREGSQKMLIIVEPGINYEDIDESSLSKWLPPDEFKTILSEKKSEIKANISDALSFMGIKHKFTDL